MRRHGPVIAHCTDSEDFPMSYIYDVSSVVTVSLFSRSVGVSMKKSVVGAGFGVYTCSPSAAVWLL